MFGEKLQSLRDSKKFTIRDLAKAAKITHSMVSDFENNKKVPGKKVLRKLANALGVSEEELTVEIPSISEKDFEEKLKLAASLKSGKAISLISELIDFCLEKEKMIDTMKSFVK